MEQALVAGPHSTGSISLGPQDPGKGLVLSPSMLWGKGVQEWYPGLLIPSLTSGLHCSASFLLADSTSWLLPASLVPLLVSRELGFVPLAVLGHICLFYTMNQSCPAAPGTRANTFLELPSYSSSASASEVMVLPTSSFLILPHPALRQPGLNLPLGLHCLRDAKIGRPGLAPSQHSGAQPCSSRQRYLGRGGAVLDLSVASWLCREPSRSVRDKNEVHAVHQLPQSLSPPTITAAGASHLFLYQLHLKPSFLSDFKSQQTNR